MLTRNAKILVGVLFGLLLVMGFTLGIVNLNSPFSAQVKDAAAVIFIVTTMAVGIERITEAAWTIINSTQGTAWPFTLVMSKMKGIAEDLDSGLAAYQQRAATLIASAAALQGKAIDTLQGAGKHLDTLHQFTADIAGVAKDHSKLEMTVSAAAQHISFIEAKYAVLVETASKAMAQEAAKSDNPDRVKELAQRALNCVIESRTEDDVVQFRAQNKALNGGLGPTEQEVQARRAEKREALKIELQTAFDTLLTEGNDPLRQAKAAFIFAHSKLELASGSVGLGFDIASQAISGMSDFVASFKDNPGRRLISLLVGAILGVLLSSVLSLDIFQAVQQDTAARAQTNTITRVSVPIQDGSAASASGLAAFKWGVILTGVLIGLGSEPTHQVIKILQETKKRRRSENDPEVVESGATLTAPAMQAAAAVLTTALPQAGVGEGAAKALDLSPAAAPAATVVEDIGAAIAVQAAPRSRSIKFR